MAKGHEMVGGINFNLKVSTMTLSPTPLLQKKFFSLLNFS